MENNPYEIQSAELGQYTMTATRDGNFVLFTDNLNKKSVYIPKRLVNTMYHLIQSNWQEENPYTETYRA